MTATRSLSELKSWDVKRIDAMYEEHGTGKKGVGIVARAFSINESAAEAMATAINERGSRRTVTESAPDLTAPAAQNRKATLAVKLQAQVHAAEGKAAERVFDPRTRGTRGRCRQRSRHVRRLIPQ